MKRLILVLTIVVHAGMHNTLYAQSFLGKDAFAGQHNISLNVALDGTPEVGIAYTCRSGLLASYQENGLFDNPWDWQIGANVDLGKGLRNGPIEIYSGVNALLGGGEEVYSTDFGVGLMGYVSMFLHASPAEDPGPLFAFTAAVLPGIYHDTYSYAAKAEFQQMLNRKGGASQTDLPEDLIPFGGEKLGHNNPDPSSYVGFSALAHYSGYLGESATRSLYGIELGSLRYRTNGAGNAQKAPAISARLDARLHLGLGF